MEQIFFIGSRQLRIGGCGGYFHRRICVAMLPYIPPDERYEDKEKPKIFRMGELHYFVDF